MVTNCTHCTQESEDTSREDLRQQNNQPRHMLDNLRIQSEREELEEKYESEIQELHEEIRRLRDRLHDNHTQEVMVEDCMGQENKLTKNLITELFLTSM